MKKICIIIPVYNALGAVKKCLKSIVKNFNFDLGNVIVIDDCSGQKTKKYVEKFTKKNNLQLFQNKENLGYLKSCNYAASKARADIVVLLNSDCEIPKYFCEKIIKCFESDENIITASPIASHSPVNYIDQIFPINIMNKFLEKRGAKYPDIFHSEGFCFCVRKSYIDEYGLFDPVYKQGYCEEIDFCFNVKNRGKRCVLIDDLYVAHKRHKSFCKESLKLMSENNKILYSKWGETFHQREMLACNKLVCDIISQSFGKFSKLIFLKKQIEKFLNCESRLSSFKNLFKYKHQKTSQKKVVYTCLTGKCDGVPVIQDFTLKGWNYVCFTDNQTLVKLKRLGMWEFRPLFFNKLDSTRNSRWHKTHPHLLFPNCEESIWIDGNINIKTEYLTEEIKNRNTNLLVPVHYCRNDIYTEAEIIKECDIDKKETVDNILNYIVNSGMPENYGLNETNVIYRKHNDEKIKKIMDDWWNMIEKYSKRDQLSFSYVLWKNGIKIEDISINNARIDELNFKFYSHKTSKPLDIIFPYKPIKP